MAVLDVCETNVRIGHAHFLSEKWRMAGYNALIMVSSSFLPLSGLLDRSTHGHKDECFISSISLTIWPILSINLWTQTGVFITFSVTHAALGRKEVLLPS